MTDEDAPRPEDCLAPTTYLDADHPAAPGRIPALGHDGDAHNHAAYIQLLRNAVLWAAGKETK